MLRFASASSAAIDTPRAFDEVIERASAGRDPEACRLVAFHVTMGHDHDAVRDAIRRRCPRARLVGCTCAGVIGREGANESMRAAAAMLAWGDDDEVAMAVVDRLDGSNARAAGARLAGDLVASRGRPRFAMLLGSGIDIDVDEAIAGIESVVGPDVTLFGGTSSDNMKAITSYQFFDDARLDHGAALVGFYDPSLEVHSRASHGFVPSGVELEVTRASGNRVSALDGGPAWRVFTRGLGLPATASLVDTIPLGAVGVALPPREAAEYRDPHLLRVITQRLDDDALLMPVTCPEGTRLALMRRDEERIFRNLGALMDDLRRDLGGRRVAAVFHADCGARGRLTLDRVAKDEIVRAMQDPLRVDGAVAPWLGMYGFGEIARLGGRNRFHNYTTALCVLSRA